MNAIETKGRQRSGIELKAKGSGSLLDAFFC